MKLFKARRSRRAILGSLLAGLLVAPSGAPIGGAFAADGSKKEPSGKVVEA